MNENKICVVCGDRANGFNFNALSCVSCKAFFRRNAPIKTELSCTFDGKCDINKKNRKLCRYCRLDKCLTAGMKKEWILSEEQRKVRKNIKEHKIRRKKKSIDENNSNCYSEDEIHSDQLITKRNDINNQSDVSVFDSQDSDSAYNSSPELVSTQEESDTDCITTEVSGDISLESKLMVSYIPFVSIPRPITDYKNNLSEIEGNFLTELLNATTVLKCPIGSITSEATTYIDGLHVMLSARLSDIERYVIMSRNLIGFNKICRTDRFNMLMRGIPKLFFLRNVNGYFNDNQVEYFTVPTDNEKSSTCLVKLDVFKAKSYLYEAKRDFYRRISREWDFDPIILDLLTAIVLFEPLETIRQQCRDDIDPQTIRNQQNIYKYLLLRYLLLKYRNEYEVRVKFNRLIKAIDYLNELLLKNVRAIQEETILDPNKYQTVLEALGI